ncbi:MAG: right-handed parallel beta-helix repeat-containing protein [Candidatus Eiseniibacteriota bacterium]
MLGVALLAVASPALGLTWNVNPAGTGDAPTIQAAFDLAAPGDQIVLAPGTYVDSHTRTVQGHSTQQTTASTAFMSAGVNIVSSSGAEVTFIDGQDVRHGLLGTDLGSVTISGITFKNCAGNAGEGWGGGIMLHRSDPTVDHCVFVDSYGWAAGGVFVSQGANAIIRYNKFIRNSGGDLAGALELFQHGGVAYISSNTFVHNTTTRYGGAVMINASTAQLSNNIYAWNSADLSGGAVACLNWATVSGSCDLYWQNTASTDPDVYACSITIGQFGNLSADPLFCDAPGGAYTIRSDSPAAPDAVGSCGLRGACPVACGPVSITASSWGRIKAHYR